jgi:hypothetical protein
LFSANESDRGNAAACFTDAKKALFIDTVHHIFKDKALGIGKGILGVIKRDAMFFNVESVFGFAPLKFHSLSVIPVCKVVNIFIWKYRDVVDKVYKPEYRGIEKKEQVGGG